MMKGRFHSEKGLIEKCLRATLDKLVHDVDVQDFKVLQECAWLYGPVGAEDAFAAAVRIAARSKGFLEERYEYDYGKQNAQILDCLDEIRDLAISNEIDPEKLHAFLGDLRRRFDSIRNALPENEAFREKFQALEQMAERGLPNRADEVKREEEAKRREEREEREDNERPPGQEVKPHLAKQGGQRKLN